MCMVGGTKQKQNNSYFYSCETSLISPIKKKEYQVNQFWKFTRYCLPKQSTIYLTTASWAHFHFNKLNICHLTINAIFFSGKKILFINTAKPKMSSQNQLNEKIKTLNGWHNCTFCNFMADYGFKKHFAHSIKMENVHM